MADPCRIRRARPADAVALAALERRCFSDPWTPAGFREALESPIGFGLVAERGDRVAGYLIARQIVNEGEILNLAVAPEARRRGLGHRLLEAGLAHLQAEGVDEVFLEVRESNVGAQMLYLGHGFRVVGGRQRYYRNPTEDALILRLALRSAGINVPPQE